MTLTRANPNKPQTEMTAAPDKYPQGRFKDKGCKQCGKLFSPQAPSHLYCGQACAEVGQTNKYLQRVYGISHDEYCVLHEEQGGVCKICQKEGFLMKDTHKMKLVVDHCHNTGAVRGLLCHNCNRALGLLKDSKEALQRALEYL